MTPKTGLDDFGAFTSSHFFLNINSMDLYFCWHCVSCNCKKNVLNYCDVIFMIYAEVVLNWSEADWSEGDSFSRTAARSIYPACLY